MTITKSYEGARLILTPQGRLDTVTAPELDQVINENIEGVKTLVFDFSKLDYISSAGLRVLLSTQKKMNRQGEMKVTGLNETVREIFEVTGFSDILTIEG